MKKPTKLYSGQVFEKIVGGKSEERVHIRVTVGSSLADTESSNFRLDGKGKRDLTRIAAGRDWTATEGEAVVTWETNGAIEKVQADHLGKRAARLAEAYEYAKRIQGGEFNGRGHAYVYDPEFPNQLTVIDGSRRMLAHAIAGAEMRVTIFEIHSPVKT